MRSRKQRNVPKGSRSYTSGGGDIAADTATIVKSDGSGTTVVDPQIAGSLNITNNYQLYIDKGEWLPLGLAFFSVLVLLFTTLHVILSFPSYWSLLLSLAFVVAICMTYWIIYDSSLKRNYLKYQGRLAKHVKKLKFFSQEMELVEAFVSLRISQDFQNPMELNRRRALTANQKEARYLTSIEIDQAVDRYGMLLILGEPGAGKTTLLQYLALQFSSSEKVLPIFVRINEYASILKDRHNKTLPSLLEYLPQALSQYGFAKSRRFLMKKLKKGEVILLLDALDEVPDDSLRSEVILAINQFTRGYSHNRVVVTSRGASYVATQGRLNKFQHTEVLEMTSQQVSNFVGKLMPKAESGELTRILNSKPSLRNLGRNPLLLSVVVMVYKNSHRLPERRADLYERCLHVLLSEWEKNKSQSRVNFNALPYYERIRRLEEIAYRFYETGNDIDMADLVEEVCNKFRVGRDDAHGFIKEIIRYSGILRYQSSKTVAFWHLSFQEYLAANYLNRQINQDGLQVIKPYVPNVHWENVLVFVSGIYEDMDALIRALVTDEPDKTRAFAVAIKCLNHAEGYPDSLYEKLLVLLAQKVAREQDLDKLEYVNRLTSEISEYPAVLDLLRDVKAPFVSNMVTTARISWLSNNFELSQADFVLEKTISLDNQWIRQWMIIDAVSQFDLLQVTNLLYQVFPKFAPDAQIRILISLASLKKAKKFPQLLNLVLRTTRDKLVCAVAFGLLLNLNRDSTWIGHLEQDVKQDRLQFLANVISAISPQAYAYLELALPNMRSNSLRESSERVLAEARMANLPLNHYRSLSNPIATFSLVGTNFSQTTIATPTTPKQELQMLTGWEDGEKLVNLVKSPTSQGRLRWEAISLLGQQQNRSSLPTLIEILNDENSDWELQRRTAIALSQFQDAIATNALALSLRTNTNAIVRSSCISALINMGTLDALAALINEIPHVGHIERRDILTALNRFRVPYQDVLAAQPMALVGRLARETDELEPEFYHLMFWLYEAVKTKASLHPTHS